MKRLLTGLIGFPIVALFFVFGNEILIDIAFAIIAIMSLHEYYKCFKEKYNPVTWIRLCCICINCNYTYNTKRIFSSYNRNNITNYYPTIIFADNSN